MPAAGAANSPPVRPPILAPTRSRRVAFRLAALLAPLVILLVLELGLRLAGYGYETAFFRHATVNGRAVLLENDKFAWRFFPPEIARAPTPTVIPAKKADGTVRIFLFGESAALGDPRPAYGVGRYLEVLLRERFPAARFEVVCVAMTAINSHAVRLIARECAGLDGDLWIVYMGHNEMEGPFGVANPFGLRAPNLTIVRAMLVMKATRVGQLVSTLANRLSGTRVRARSWAGMKTMAQQQIPPQAPAKETVYRNFEQNLDAILEAGHRAGVPILLSTVACNLRECGPFASHEDAALAETDRAGVSELRSLAQKAIATQRPLDAVEHYQAATALARSHAELHFRLAHAWLAATNDDQARASFVKARDLDALPFRADSRLDQLIRAAAERHRDRGVALGDAEAVLSADASGRSPGAEVFYEHVHLNFDGNYRLARAFADHVGVRLPAEAQADQRSEWLDAATCQRRLGLTDWNRYAVLESILLRMQDAPFTNQLGNPSRLRAVQTELVRLKSELQPRNYVDARAIYDEALVLAPDDFRLSENYAEFLEATGEFAEASQQWERVLALVSHHVVAHFHLARVQTRLGQYEPAAQHLGTALELRPEFVEARLALGQNLVHQGKPEAAIVEYRAVLRAQPGNPTALLRLADVLAAQNRRPEAMTCLEQAVELHPTFWEARYFLGIELVAEEKVTEARDQFAEVVRLRPDFPLGHLNYGVALAKLGQVKEAYAHFRATLRLDPNNVRATEYLRTLEAATRPAPPDGDPPPAPPASDR